MKEDKKVKNMLQKYLQWPLVLSLLVICGNPAPAQLYKNLGIVLSKFKII